MPLRPQYTSGAESYRPAHLQTHAPVTLKRHTAAAEPPPVDHKRGGHRYVHRATYPRVD